MNKNILKEKNYILPSFILPVIYKYNLMINECLLLIYFLNGNLVFDVLNIENDLKMEESDVLEAFNGLLKSKLIFLETKKNDQGKLEELVNLDYLYNEVLAFYQKEEKEEINQDIFSIFETEFGRTISSMEYEIIRAWLEKGFTEELILGALREAVYNGVSNLRYIDKILHEWQRKGYKNMTDVNNHNSKTNTVNNNDIQDLLDYNWFDDDNE